jgi:CheY-like chemotaxis protein
MALLSPDDGPGVTPAAEKARLLLIDDEPMIATLIQRSLHKSWDVTWLASAADALERLKSESFDVIVCDLMMPIMDGMQFAAELETLNPVLRGRTMFLTGGAVNDASEQFLARPDVRYMSKPLSMRDLDTALKKISGLE